MRLSDSAGDGVHRAVTCTLRAADTFIRIDPVTKQALTYTSRAFLVIYVSKILVTEISHRRHNRIGRGLAETTQGAVLDRIGNFCHKVEILFLALTLGDTFEDFLNLRHTFTACGTFTAGLFTAEVHEETSNLYHAGILTHNNKSAGTDDGSNFLDGIEVKRKIQMIFRQTAAGRTADLDGFEFSAILQAAADIINDLSQRGSEWNLDQTGTVDGAGKRECLGAGAALGADTGVPFGTLGDDHGDVCIALDVVEQCGSFKQALINGTVQFRTRLAAVAFDGFQKQNLHRRQMRLRLWRWSVQS